MTLPSSIFEGIDAYCLEQGIDLGADRRYIVAVSTGADSLFLAYYLSCRLDASQLLLVYVDHGTRPDEIPEEKRLLNVFCERFGLTSRCVSLSISVGLEGFETKAREARYAALEAEAMAFQADGIFVAHHLDDHAETLMMQLAAGAKNGAIGIRSQSTLGGTPLLRPLLSVPKSALVGTLQALDITFSIDSSNADTTLIRNFWRHEVLPKIRTRYTDFHTHLAGFSDHMQETQSYFRRYLSADLDTVLREPARILIWKWAVSISDPFLARQFVYLLGKDASLLRSVRLTSFHVDRLAEMLLSNRPSSLRLPGNIEAVSDRSLVEIRNLSVAAETSSWTIGVGDVLKLPDWGYSLEVKMREQNASTDLELGPWRLRPVCVAADDLDAPNVRFAEEADQITLDGQSRSVYSFLGKKDVSPLARAKWPVLIQEGDVVAVLGHCVADAFLPSASSNEVWEIRPVK